VTPASTSPDAWRLRLLALLEVAAVYAGGAILGLLLAKMAGVPLRNPLQALADDPAQDLLPIAWELAGLLFWQYLGWLLTALALRLARGRVESSAEAPTAERMRGRSLVFLALVTASLATLPQRLITLANEYWGLGEQAAWKQALLSVSWGPDFWVLMAVGSFGLIPIIEELFYRGWVLARLRKAWPDALSILFVAGLFACSHSQYLRLDALNLLTLASVGFGAIVYAGSVVHARSLLPAIGAHMIINIPKTPALMWVEVAVMAVFLVISWQKWAQFRQTLELPLRGLCTPMGLAALIVGALLAISFHHGQDLLALAGLGLWVALLAGYLVARLRRRRRSA
jgi:membrane protease YdiL (CAAX protease family)